MKNLSTN